MKLKKKLTNDQEFEIMKLVLDKFLWVGTFIMMFGLWFIMAKDSILDGIVLISIGAIVLVLFLVIVVKEYEIIS